MPPESDPHFKAAFAELHRRQCAQAPALEAMRSRALRAANAGRRPLERRRLALRISLAATGVCLALFGLWSLQMPQANPTASARRVEQLLAAIEQQLDRNADLAEPEFEFPTDLLLTQNQTDPEP
ncbi:MAG TPA: hypothetical protein VGO11_15185 [Chthoniobacteraceae bacterium]|jgi:hypothetical protein|nr:hypothetical protein [Chthoniobacteraceae bacterium]